MERDSSDKPTGRFTSPLVINSASRRRSLFLSRPRSGGSSSAPNSPDGAARLASSSAAVSPDSKPALSANTKIPRPASTRPSQARRPFPLSEAYRMAKEEEEQEAAQGSPSPAPRLWRSRPPSSDGKLQKATGPTPRRRPVQPGELSRQDTANSIENLDTLARKSDDLDSDFDEKLRQHALEGGGSEDVPQRGSGLFSKRLGARISETAKELVRKSSRNSLEGDSPSRAPRSVGSNSWISRRLSARKSSSDQSLFETGAHESPLGDSAETPAAVPPHHRSPEKSFAWQADEDFTAGDLQVSSSPPVIASRSNTKIDEIRALEADVASQLLPPPPQPRKRNTKLDEIRALERETALEFKHEPIHENESDGNNGGREVEADDRYPPSWQPTPALTKRDELRAREMESLSRKALATARLDEIRERHATGPSRSPTPDAVRKQPSRDILKSFPPVLDGIAAEEKRGYDVVTASRDAPSAVPPIDEAVILESAGNDKGLPDGDIHEMLQNGHAVEAGRPATESRKDSHDFLRRLALAANSPAADLPVASDKIAARDRTRREGSRQRMFDSVKGSGKPTVGFVGLRREPSADSLSDKRSSFAQSDIDPTERIEREMQLFAPLENHSEKGSLRAPSPPPGVEDVEETPRPAKPDPLTQPTPRVTGAFVDTPVTVKADAHHNIPVAGVPPLSFDGQKTGNSGSDVVTEENEDTNPLARGRKTGGSSQNLCLGLSVKSEKSDKISGRASSLPGRRRSKSSAWARIPLRNSARPPTVKGDLLEIRKANQFDDSTLEDLADLLGKQDDSEKDAAQRAVKVESSTSNSLSEREKELEAYSKLSRSLETGLLGIRAAKQGIERLEDKVLHGNANDSTTSTIHPVHPTHSPTEHPSTEDSPLTYIQLPFPRLWYGRPRFRLTLTGLVLFILSFWYIAESAMCTVYCKPQICYPGQPCDWSPDDPRWGYAIPVKLDQWLTGGRGRALAVHVQPEVEDWLADIRDAATGTDITRLDISRFTRGQRRQHRRRLLKRGLAKTSNLQPEDRAKLDAWSAARMDKDNAAGEDDETMSADEKI